MATKAVTVKKEGGAVVDYNKILADLARRQQKAAASLSSGGNWASFKAGQLVINGAALKDNKAQIIVLATMQERAYYPDEFDPDNKVPPVCYAYGGPDGDAPSVPHEKSSDKQAETCAECPHSQFGSAVRGRGQACRQAQRLAFIAADGKTEGESQIVQAKIPPTSLKHVKGWLDELGAREISSVQVVTEMAVRPDPKNQFAIELRPVMDVKPGVLNVVIPRIAAAERLIVEPYPETEETTPAKPARKAAKRKFK